MKNKSNLTIKVKYPTSGQKSEDDIFVPKVITQWNVKRIAMAAILALTSLALLLYFSFRTEPKSLAVEKITNPTVNTAAQNPIVTPAENKVVSPEIKSVNPVINKNILIAKKTENKPTLKKKTSSHSLDKTRIIKSKSAKKQKPIIKKKRHAKKRRVRH